MRRPYLGELQRAKYIEPARQSDRTDIYSLSRAELLFDVRGGGGECVVRLRHDEGETIRGKEQASRYARRIIKSLITKQPDAVGDVAKGHVAEQHTTDARQQFRIAREPTACVEARCQWTGTLHCDAPVRRANAV